MDELKKRIGITVTESEAAELNRWFCSAHPLATCCKHVLLVMARIDQDEQTTPADIRFSAIAGLNMTTEALIQEPSPEKSAEIALQKKKNRARSIAASAIARGELVRPEVCPKCGEPFPHAHHESYDRPLDVTWLCRKCHGRRHAEINAEARG